MRCMNRSTTRWSSVVVGWLALVVLFAAVGGTAAADTGNSQNAHLCQDGWMELATSDGEGFTNVGDCVSYAARGGTLSPANPYPEAKALCESFGGTFGVGGPDLTGASWDEVLWVCNGWTPPPDVGGTLFEFRLRCLADGGANLITSGSSVSDSYSTCGFGF